MLGNFDFVISDFEKDGLDLAFHSSGIDQCEKGNLYGPRNRRYHLIHFVISGKGKLTIDSETYMVKSGQAFYIPSGCMASYKADSYHPWRYCWIGYRGTQASKFSKLLFSESYIIDIKNITLYEYKIMELLSCTDPRINLDFIYNKNVLSTDCFSDAKTFPEHLMLNGKLKELFSSLLYEQEKNFVVLNNADYADKAKYYIETRYSEAIQISDIASYLNLNSHYMTAIFKKKFNMTPKKYLTNIRIEKAKIYLKDTEHSLQAIANAIGFENSFSFSRLFKSITGMSPASYRMKYSTKK